MRFKVTRVSVAAAGRPCDEAYPAMFPFREHLSRREEQIPGAVDLWHTEGRDHVHNGEAWTRIIDRPGWAIDIPNLDALLAFTHKYDGRVVLFGADNEGVVEIEIYDDYRE